MPGLLRGVYSHPSGGGKLLAILQIGKRSPADEGRQRQAALTAFAAFPELKHVILVDEDVNIFDTNDVLWAMTFRYQGDADTVFIPGVHGAACQTIFDCTVPHHLKERFRRAGFVDVDLEKYGLAG
jgi:4-hydroxy-3-polyprenylbenzoate decarboxylase